MRLLEMSISAGVLILLLAVLRRGDFWNLTKRTVMGLWMVVLARLLLPGSLPIRNGIAVPVLGLLQRVCSLHINTRKGAGAHHQTAALVPEAASFGTAASMGSGLLLQAAGWLWLAGMAGACVYFACSFWKEYRLLAQALPLESVLNGMPGSRVPGMEPETVRKSAACIQIRESCRTACRLAGMHPQKKTVRILVHDRIRSPLVFGIVRQKVIIPKSLLDLEQAQMQYILTHEMVHIRRHDNLWKLLSAAAVCIHWFNPAVWLMYVLSARDLELSCDEQVLSAYGSQGRQGYAMTLLALAQNQTETTLFCSGFMENPVKERIVAIMKYRKLTGIGALCAVMLFAGAASVFAANGDVQAQDTDGPGQAAEAGGGIENEERGPAESLKAKVKGQDKDTIILEVNPDVDLQGEQIVTVTFDSPVTLEDGEEKEMTYYVDESGVMHAQDADIPAHGAQAAAGSGETDAEAAVDAQKNNSYEAAVEVDAAGGGTQNESRLIEVMDAE